MVENAFAISRKLFDNPIWYHETFTRGQAWVDLIGNANYVDSEFMVRGNLVKIKRGQIGWSELTMAKRWKWSRNKVRRFLSMLEMKHQIEQQKNNVTTVITILNYENYQFQINGTIQQNDTAERQQKDSRKTADDTHTNKVNKVNNIPYREIVDLYNSICKDFTQVKIISKSRENNIKFRWNKFALEKGIKIFEELFTNAQGSDWLSGRNGKWTNCSFDWIMEERNMVKILEGNYKNREIKDDDFFRT